MRRTRKFPSQLSVTGRSHHTVGRPRHTISNQMERRVPEQGLNNDAPPTYEWACAHAPRTPTPEDARRALFNQPMLSLQKLYDVNVRGTIQDCRFDVTGSHIYVRTDSPRNPVLKYGFDATLVRSFGSSKSVQGSVAFDTRRDLLVSASGDSIFRTTRLGLPPGMFYAAYLKVKAARNINHLCYMATKDMYLATDIELHSILMVDAVSGDVKSRFGCKGPSDCNFNRPHSVAFNPDGKLDRFAVTDSFNHCVKLFTMKGRLAGIYGCYGDSEGQLTQPSGVCVDMQGRVVVCDQKNRRVVRFNPQEGRAKWECVISPEQLEGKEPIYVDVSSNGHLVISAVTSSSQSTKHSWTLYRGYS